MPFENEGLGAYRGTYLSANDFVSHCVVRHHATLVGLIKTLVARCRATPCDTVRIDRHFGCKGVVQHYATQLELIKTLVARCCATLCDTVRIDRNFGRKVSYDTVQNKTQLPCK
jgi:hypothetical protein